MRSDPRKRLVATFALALVIPLGAGGSAEADPWGTNTAATGAHPDSDPHTFCYSSSVGSNLQKNITDAEWGAMDPTGVNVDYQSSCDLNSGTETDVVWRQADLPNNVVGATYCEDFDTYCDQFYVTLDLPEINEGIEDEIDQSITTCHELGHTGGLTHGFTQNDCMENVSTSNPPNELRYQRYSDHHINDHLNPWFN